MMRNGTCWQPGCGTCCGTAGRCLPSPLTHRLRECFPSHCVHEQFWQLEPSGLQDDLSGSVVQNGRRLDLPVRNPNSSDTSVTQGEGKVIWLSSWTRNPLTPPAQEYPDKKYRYRIPQTIMEAIPKPGTVTGERQHRNVTNTQSQDNTGCMGNGEHDQQPRNNGQQQIRAPGHVEMT